MEKAGRLEEVDLEPRKLNWINITVLGITPVFTALALFVYISQQGFSFYDLIPFVIMSVLCGLAITGGYHRLWSHRAYDCSPLVQLVFLCFGAAQVENSVLAWCADHRHHHRHVDKDGDPYNINKGFFWAHMGWILYEDTAEKKALANVKDLEKSALIRFQHRFYIPLAVIFGAVVPYCMGLAWGRPFGAFLFGGMLRLVLLHHSTFLINSAAHFFGKQPYSTQNTARDSFWLALFTYGEGYHNFHHAFPSDYRNGIKWHHWDPTKWLIQGLNAVGMSKNLKQVSDETIALARKKVIEEKAYLRASDRMDAAIPAFTISPGMNGSSPIART